MQHSATPPVPGAVLVVERRNSWVKVLEPESGRTRWVDLAEATFECASADAHARESAPDPARG